MIYNLEEAVHDKTPGLNTPEIYVFTHNRFKTYMVLILVILTKLGFIKCHIELVHIMKLKYL